MSFSSRNRRTLMWMSLGSNSMALHATRPTKQSNYWKQLLVFGIILRLGPVAWFTRFNAAGLFYVGLREVVNKHTRRLTPWKRIFSLYGTKCCKKRQKLSWYFGKRIFFVSILKFFNLNYLLLKVKANFSVISSKDSNQESKLWAFLLPKCIFRLQYANEMALPQKSISKDQ